MSVSLCETFQSLAFATHRRLAKARRVLHQPLEETFTDLNILELKYQHPAEIYSKTFTKHHEGLNGADWEWWLTNSSRSLWLDLRVQAKVLHLATDTFPHLHYQSGSPRTYQLHKLQTGAVHDGLVPLYCLYTHGVSRRTVRGRQCLLANYSSQSYGCSLISTTHVARLQAAAKTDDLHSVMKAAVPWHCLVCCTGHAQGSDLPNRAWAYLQDEFRALENAITDAKAATRLGPRSHPPHYVLRILDGLFVVDPPPSVQGVLVIAPRDDG